MVATVLAWWTLLSGPLLYLLHYPVALVLWPLPGPSGSPVQVSEAGDWSFRVPIWGRHDNLQPLFGSDSGHVKVRSAKIVVGRDQVLVFTLAFPIYWAVILTAPATYRRWRVWLVGDAILAVVATGSLLLFAVYTINRQLHLLSSPTWIWILGYAEYVTYYAIPYAAPLVVAVLLHEELRQQIFVWTTPASTMTNMAPPKARKAVAKRRR